MRRVVVERFILRTRCRRSVGARAFKLSFIEARDKNRNVVKKRRTEKSAKRKKRRCFPLPGGGG